MIQTARCLDANMHKGVTPKGFYDKKEHNLVLTFGAFDEGKISIREHQQVGESPTLKQSMGTGGNNVPMVMDYRKDEGFRPRDNESPSLTSHGDSTGGIPVPMVNTNKLRRLTPIECERLQGFPDNWTAGVSDTQRYKQLGNAVTVNVIEAIIQQFNLSLDSCTEL